MKDLSDTTFHSLSVEEATAVLKTDTAAGLSDQEVKRRQEEFGSNSIEEKKKISPLLIFLHQFKSPIVFLLLGAAGLSFWFKEWLDGLAILIVIIINTVIGFYMEWGAERSMQALKKLSSASAKVLRNKRLTEMSSDTLVPGDVIFIESGDLVPADGRIFKLSQLQADESALTGESVPVEKQTQRSPADAGLAERINMLYKGTFISKGNGYMVVTATGMSTELGKVASLVESAEQSVTPLEKKLETFSKKLIIVTLGLVVIIFISGMLNSHSLIEMLQTSIALAVAAIPEGLPIVATMALAQGMMKMARHKVIIKKLSAVETLGGTNVICVDKTGTLTKNKIEVKSIIPVSEKAKDIIREVSILCNTAELHLEGNKLKELGDPLETALLKYYSDNGSEVSELRLKFPKKDEEPFSSETKIMATLHQAEKGFIVYAKGAAEELILKCTKISDESGEKEMDEAARQHWLGEAENLAASGMRVIAAAYKTSLSSPEDLSSGLTFTGLIAMIDPPREEVFAAIEECRSAGINIIMITGDHPATAKNIALQLKITDEKDAGVIIGKNMKDYEHISDDEKNRWASTHVFARVSPQQKLDIVKVLQEKRYTVGMTGDGINDAPALKKADIGIAMGERGTQVAQEVADMILKDDSFTSIVLAIKQGRIIFENIRKFVIYLLSCNLSELLVISVAAVFNLHFQLIPLQILFINLITDVLPALALGMAKGSDQVMKVPPGNESEPIIDKKRWWAIIFYSAVISVVSIGAVLFSHYTIHSNIYWNAQLCNNILFFTLIFTQLLHVLNMANSGAPFFKSEVFKSPYIWYSILASLLILFTLYLFEPVRQVLSVQSMPVADWLVCIAASFVSVIIIQLAKKIKLVRQ